MYGGYHQVFCLFQEPVKCLKLVVKRCLILSLTPESQGPAFYFSLWGYSLHCFLPLTFLTLRVSLAFMVTGRVVFLKTQICRTVFHALRLTQKWQNFLYRMCCLQNSRQSTRHCASFFAVWGSRCSHLSFAWEEREHGDPLGYHANLSPEKERRKGGGDFVEESTSQCSSKNVWAMPMESP